MPENTNTQLVEFCNADLRQIADAFVQVVSRSEGANATYLARNLGTVIENGGPSKLIADGSAEDGRTRCTGGDVYNIITLITDFMAFMTPGRRDVIAKWKVNGDR